MSIDHQSLIALFNPKSPSNVGAVLRAAGCYGVSEVRYSGERFDRAQKYQTDTKNAQNKIPLRRVEDLLEGYSPNTALVCIELVEGATPLPDFEHPKNACYILGPEDGSLPQSMIDNVDSVVYIPTFGCMNLAATVNVCLLYTSPSPRDATLSRMPSSA